MDNCKYELNIEGTITKFNSEKELSDFILLNKLGSKDQTKFSTELVGRQGEVFNAILNSANETSYNNKANLTSFQFLSNKHDLGNGEVYLAPEFDTENYINGEIKEAAKAAKSRGVEFSIEEEVALRRDLEQELNENEIMKDAGRALHALATKALEYGYTTDARLEPLLNSFIDTIEKHNKKDPNFVLYSTDQKKDIKKNIKKEIGKFIAFAKNISSEGLVKPNLVNESAAVKDRPDLIVIDQNGEPHIFDIVLSRKAHAFWHSAKVLNSDYKLAIQRQLLESVCPTDNSALYVSPFVLPATGNILDLNSFSLSSIVRRDTEKYLDFTGGKISKAVKQLIPSKFTNLHIRNTDLDRKNEDLLAALFPNYKIRSKFALENKEKVIKEIKDNKRPNEPYILYDRLVNKRINIEKEEDIAKAVDDYQERYNKAKNSETYKLKRTIQDAIKSGTKDSITFTGKNSDLVINTTFEKYLGGDWELIDNNVFTNQDLFVFRNNTYNTIEVVSLTTNNLNTIHSFGLGNTLLGKYRTNTEAKKDQKIEEASTTNIEIIKVLAILNNTPELFKNCKLSNIKVLNYVSDRADTANVENLIYNFSQLYKLTNRNGELQALNNFDSKNILLAEPFDELYKEIMHLMSASENSKLRDLAKGTRLDLIESKIEWLTNLHKKLVAENKELQKNPDVVPDYSSPKLQLYNLVSQGLAYYSGIKFNFDYNMPRWGIKLSDFGHLPQTIAFGEGREYDKNGERVVGLFGGSAFSIASEVLSSDIRQLNDLVSIGHDKIRESYIKIQNPITNATNKYYEACNRPDLEKILIGKANPYHEVFFKKNTAGKIANEFTFVNPYDMNENLKDHEREYLKTILWEMYKFKIVVDDKFKNLNHTEAKKLPEFEDFIKEPKYFEAPLMKKLDLSKWGSLTTKGFRDAVGKRWEELKDSLDPRQITETQRRDAEEQVTACYKMYNEFDMDKDKKDSLVANYGVEYFEVNLDTMLLKYAFSSIRENVMNQILPIINAATTVIKYHGYQSGNSDETNKAMEDFYEQLRAAVYGVNSIKGEVMESMAAIKSLQKIASIMMITLRPVLMFKELITGTIKNVSYAWTKVYGDNSFTVSDLSTAYNKVLFSKAQSPIDFTITDNLNLLYGIANMDLNNMVTKTKTDRAGLYKFFSEHLYWMNNAPDYVNRLTLFVAKMVHDGSYDAHFMNEKGEFEYNPKKDKRFDKYFERREKYNFKFTENDKEYNDQRSLYITMLEDFNLENIKLNKEKLDEKLDLIPRAYTHKEKESIKVFADMAYGSYDHERMARWKHTAWGSIFGQFLTYWPSKVKYYFGKEMKSSYGQYEQKFQIDPDTGAKQLLWLKEITDDEGNFAGYEDTTENTGIKSNHFMGSPFEGLFYSLFLTSRDILHGNFDKTPDIRKKRAMVAIHDLFMGILVCALINALLQDFAENKETNQAKVLTAKAFYKASNEFDPFASVFKAFKWEPAFISMSSNVGTGFLSLFAGKSDLETMFRNNFKMLEVLPRFTEQN